MWGLCEPGQKCISYTVSLALPWRKRELEIKEFFFVYLLSRCLPTPPPGFPGQNQALGLSCPPGSSVTATGFVLMS